MCYFFQARIKFPIDYPYSPPAFRFLTKMWHPNIYEVILKPNQTTAWSVLAFIETYMNSIHYTSM